jgi:hypothetical protein
MSKLDNATTSRIESEHTKVDVVACIASFVDALACLIFLLWQTKLTNAGRSYIECIVDPISCLIGYRGFYRRLYSLVARGGCNAREKELNPAYRSEAGDFSCVSR